MFIILKPFKQVPLPWERACPEFSSGTGEGRNGLDVNPIIKRFKTGFTVIAFSPSSVFSQWEKDALSEF